MHYDVSVITPACRPDQELFDRALASMVNQTCGFEKLEWIIVIHNSSDEEYSTVLNKTKNYENIKVLRLNNEAHTPSSPRNYAFDFATGDYIAFLDCDDFYQPYLFEKVVPVMLSSGAEMGSFRYECLSKDGLVNIFPCMMLDQTREVVEVDTDDWDSSQYIYGAALNITSKIYLRSFIEENHFRFDEKVPLAEDNLFNLHCLSKARKIIFFPQLIGYGYWMNAGSLVQSFSKNDEKALLYANGVNQVLSYALSTNLYTDYVVCDLLGFVAAICMASMDLSLETRQKINEILSPYIGIVKSIRPGKLYSPSLAKNIMLIPKIFIGKPEFCDKFMKVMKLMHVDMSETMTKQMNGH